MERLARGGARPSARRPPWGWSAVPMSGGKGWLTKKESSEEAEHAASVGRKPNVEAAYSFPS